MKGWVPRRSGLLLVFALTVIAIVAGFQASAYADEFTPPDPISAFAAVPGSGVVHLSWWEPGDSDYDHTVILRSTTGYATDIWDPTQEQVFSNMGGYYDDWAVTNGVLYYYTGFALDTYWNVSEAAYVQATPVDAAPGPVTALAAVPDDREVQLSWTKPGDSDLGAVRVLRSTVGFASSASDTAGQTTVYSGLGMSCTDEDRSGGVTCYYTVYVRDQGWQWSVPTTAQATPWDDPPRPVQSLTATAGDEQVALQWYAPTNSDAAGVRLFGSATGFCESPTDAARQVGQTQIHDEAQTPGSLGTHVDSPLVNGVAQYYTAFARDGAGGWSVAATTTATPVEPPPGSISGTLTGQGQGALAGRAVEIYRWSGSAWTWQRRTVTVSGGPYSFPNLAAGTYRVWFEGQAGTWMPEYYHDATRLADAQDVTVTAGQTTTADEELAGAGTLSGTLTGQGQGGIVGRAVEVYRWSGSAWTWHRRTVTTSGGAYSFASISPGTYRLWFEGLSGTWASEYYHDAMRLANAGDVAVTAGQTTTADEELSGAGTLSGTLTGQGQGGLVGRAVEIYRWSGSAWTWHRRTVTSSGGAYSFAGLAAGTYRVWFEGQTGTWVPEYYHDAARLADAQSVTVTTGQATTVDEELAAI